MYEILKLLDLFFIICKSIIFFKNGWNYWYVFSNYYSCNVIMLILILGYMFLMSEIKCNFVIVVYVIFVIK